jgi:hypothetical protein
MRVPRKIDAGEVLAAAGGVLVFVALFLDWFVGASGWEAFEALDLVIAVLALVAVGAVVSSIAGTSSGPSARVLPWVGGVLLAIVAVQLIEPPPTFFEIDVQAEGDGYSATSGSFDPERELGAWLALAGSALVLIGGVLRAARISVTVSVGERDVRRRVPAVDRRPTASAASALGFEPDQATQPFTAAVDDGDPGAAAAPGATAGDER